MKILKATTSSNLTGNEQISSTLCSHADSSMRINAGQCCCYTTKTEASHVCCSAQPAFCDRIHGDPEASLEFLRLLHGISCGLAHMHARNLCHLDVKTDNILLGRPSRERTGQAGSKIRWTPKLADFGLALKVDGRTGTTYLSAGDYRYAQPVARSPCLCALARFAAAALYPASMWVLSPAHLSCSDSRQAAAFSPKMSQPRMHMYMC